MERQGGSKYEKKKFRGGEGEMALGWAGNERLYGQKEIFNPQSPHTYVTLAIPNP